jgi:alanine-glyoxylate transaminase / (R)-3-amino-2-methylpropionate-pyruvate transaminase
MDANTIRTKHRKHLLKCTGNYYEQPLVLVEGKGRHLTDIDGRRFLDFFGGILTVSIGHADERINAAVKKQVDKVTHTSTLYPTLPIVEYAEMLSSMCPPGLTKCFFTASGTEADETAVMLAQVHTGQQEIIALRHGYSGRSMLAQSLTAHAPFRAVTTQVAAIKHAPAPYCYRCPMRLSYPSCEVACARDIEELIRTTTRGSTVAAFLAEPIQGVGGFVTPPKEYLPTAVEIVRKYGGLFICDEVQTGFGRTGGKMWGCEQFGVTPDIMTMAKGIANGMPLGATVTTEAIDASMKYASISTFGGNPVSCAAAIATLDVIVRDKLVANAARTGGLLQAGLKELQGKYPDIIGDVRGMGLMQALELVVDETAGDRTPNPRATLRLFEETCKRGLLIGKGGLYGNTIRIAPALTVTDTEVADALRILEESFAAMSREVKS